MHRSEGAELSGTTLRGRYVLGERIGRGGMGDVYVAEDRSLGRRVAIKVLRDPEAAGPDLERFRREAMTAARLAHPHIAPVIDFSIGGDGEPAAIVMELLDGDGLDAVLRREPVLPIDRALVIAIQVASALAAAHAAGVVHRDIKPENIFLVRSALGDLVKVLDFGIAKLAGMRGLTGTDQIVGTVEYMSPEQAMGRESGPATDVWALGAVLYKMLSGSLPFRERGVNEILAALHRGDIVPLAERVDGVPRALIAVVDRALAIEPSDRYRDGAELLAALEPLRGAMPAQRPVATQTDAVATRRETPRAESVRAPAPRRLLLAGALLVAAGTATVVWIVASRDGARPQAPPVRAVETPADAAPADAAPAVSDAPPDASTPDAGPDATQPRTPPPPAPRSVVKDVSVVGYLLDPKSPENWEREEQNRAYDVLHAKLDASSAVLAPCLRGLPLRDNRRIHIDANIAADGTTSAIRLLRSNASSLKLTPQMEACIAKRLRAHVGVWNDVGAWSKFELTLRLD